MQDKRRYPRYPLYCPVQFKREYSEAVATATTVNISEGGALIPTKDFAYQNSPITVKIFIKQMPFFVKARIVHVQYENDKGYYNMGLEFKQLPPNFATMLYEELKEVESYKSRLSYGRETPVSLREAAATYYEQNQ